MIAERLLNVAKALRESPNPEKFHMSAYARSCGTPACALGHYAARTDLQQAFILSLGFLCTDYGAEIAFHSPKVRSHFDISREEAEELFSPDGCGGARTALEAARYVENFVRERTPS